MNWSHRLLRHKNGDLEIVEMYYEDGKTMGYCRANVFATEDEGIGSILKQVQWFSRAAIEHPIVDEW